MKLVRTRRGLWEGRGVDMNEGGSLQSFLFPLSHQNFQETRGVSVLATFRITELQEVNRYHTLNIDPSLLKIRNLGASVK